MRIGIDRFGLAIPDLYVDLREVALRRGDEPDKYTIGIGQDEQAVAPSSQDIVTLGAAAVMEFRGDIDDKRLGLLVVGTESGVDSSKASALYIHRLLGLSKSVRCLETKEACYGGTAALMMARDYVAAHPDKQALVIAADIARYGLATSGEVTQGAAAVAMLVSAAPRVLDIHDDSVVRSEDIQDFWRPLYTDCALTRGKYSTLKYIEFFDDVWDRYREAHGCGLDRFAALCFHLPFSKMGLKALRSVLPQAGEEQQRKLLERYQASTRYCRRIGNAYTGSLYLGILSLLENDDTLRAGDELGIFSYGSGAVGEFFTASLAEGYADNLDRDGHLARLAHRRKLSVDEYEAVFSDKIPYSAKDYRTDEKYHAGPFVLTDVTGQERHYAAR